MTAIARTAALCLVGCLTLAACGGTEVATDQPGGGPIAAPAASTTTTTTATTTTTTAAPPPTSTTSAASNPATTTTTRKGVTAATVLAEFKTLVKRHCAPAYTGGDTHVPMPDAVSARLKSGSKWLIKDDENIDEMLFDRAAGTVTSERGPEGMLGQTYVFECDPKIFISPVA